MGIHKLFTYQDDLMAPIELEYAHQSVPRRSTMAVAAAIFGLCGLPTGFGLEVLVAGVSPSGEGMGPLFPLLFGFGAIAFPIVAIGRIAVSKGRLHGLAWALVGLVSALLWVAVTVLWPAEARS